MFIQFKSGIAGHDFSFDPGDVAEWLNDEEAAELCKRGTAKELTPDGAKRAAKNAGTPLRRHPANNAAPLPEAPMESPRLVLKSCANWKWAVEEFLDDIDAWRGHEANRFDVGSPPPGWRDGSHELWESTSFLCETMARFFPRLNPAPLHDVFGFANRWWKEKSAAAIPDDVSLRALAEHSIIIVNTVESAAHQHCLEAQQKAAPGNGQPAVELQPVATFPDLRLTGQSPADDQSRPHQDDPVGWFLAMRSFDPRKPLAGERDANPFQTIVACLEGNILWLKEKANSPMRGNALLVSLNAWRQYPLMLWMIEEAALQVSDKGEMSGPNRINAVSKLNLLHVRATKIIGGFAVSLGITDANPILLSAAYCRNYFSERYPAQLTPKGDGLHWPECLKAWKSTLSDDEQRMSVLGGVLISQLWTDARFERQDDGTIAITGIIAESVNGVQDPADPAQATEQATRDGAATGSVPTVQAILTFSPGEFTYRGHTEQLTGIPLKILQALWEAPNKTLKRDVLRERFWGDNFVENNTIGSHVSTIRDALRKAIGTVHGNREVNPIEDRDRGDNLAWRLNLPQV